MSDWIQDNGVLKLSAFNTRHADAIMRDPAHKITGAVEWVDNPDIFRVFWPRSPTFLADECMVGVGFL